MLSSVARSPQVNRGFVLGQCYEFTLPIHRCGYLLRPFEFGVRWFFRYVVNLSCRVIGNSRQRDGRRDVLHVAARRSPSCRSLRKENFLPAVGDALHNGIKPVQRITRPVDHWQSQNGSGKLRIAKHRPLHWNFVVLVVNPSEHALQSLEHWRRIGLRFFTETGLFSEWKWLQRTGFTAVQHTAGTINIHAAQNDNAAFPRWKTATSCPPSTRPRTTCGPMNPLAPIKSIRMKMQESLFLPIDNRSSEQLPSVHPSSANRKLQDFLGRFCVRVVRQISADNSNSEKANQTCGPISHLLLQSTDGCVFSRFACVRNVCLFLRPLGNLYGSQSWPSGVRLKPADGG